VIGSLGGTAGGEVYHISLVHLAAIPHNCNFSERVLFKRGTWYQRDEKNDSNMSGVEVSSVMAS